MRILGLELIPHLKARKDILSKIDELKSQISKIEYMSPVAADKAHMIDPSRYFNMSSEKYTESGLGLMSRIISSKTDIKELFEEPIRKFISDIDFKKHTVVCTIFDRGTFLHSHYHSFDETITVIEGSVRVLLSGEVLTKGESQYVPKYMVHYFEPLEKGMTITTIPKK